MILSFGLNQILWRHYVKFEVVTVVSGFVVRSSQGPNNFVSHFEFLSQNSNPAWPVVAIPESSNLHVPVLDVRRMVRLIPYQFEGHDDKGNSTTLV